MGDWSASRSRRDAAAWAEHPRGKIEGKTAPG
nr:MAG TPA: hypothetical protein [Caudoviricetes sp.]